MINQITLVGRIVKTPDLFYTESGKTGTFITLAVGRTYKNQDGQYDTDFIDCTLWSGVAESTAEYCKTGDVVGIRGRIQTRIVEDENGNKQKIMEIIADRVTFLASSGNKKGEHVVMAEEPVQNTTNKDTVNKTNKNKIDKKKDN